MLRTNHTISIIQANTIPITFWYFSEGQISFLKSKGFKIIAICSPGEMQEEFKEREEIELIPVEMTREITPFKDLKALYKIFNILKKINPQIMHGSTPKAGFLTMLASTLAGTPIRLFFMRGLRFTELSGWKKSIVKITEKITCWCAHQVLCTSPSVYKIAIENNVCSIDKIKVLHNGTGNGIDAVRFNPAEYTVEDCLKIKSKHNLPADSLVLLFVGRLVRDKGVIELTSAWELLKKHNPNLHLVVAGDIELEDPIPEKVHDKLKRDSRVHLLGWIEDVKPMYAIADILVLPTYREGIPIALLEAAAMEVSVVATKVTGCVDAVVDGETGILVQAKDSMALAEGIRTLIGNPELRDKMGKAARKRVIRDFKPEDVWEALYQEYIRLLQEKKLPTPETCEEG